MMQPSGVEDVMLTVNGGDVVAANAVCNNVNTLGNVWVGETITGDNLGGYWLNGVWYPYQPAQPIVPDYWPWLPTVLPNACTCCRQTLCLKCLVDAVEKAKMQMTVVTPAPAKTVADTLLAQAKSRADEIQKRLDEVPALESELARLKKIIDAAG